MGSWRVRYRGFRFVSKVKRSRFLYTLVGKWDRASTVSNQNGIQLIDRVKIFYCFEIALNALAEYTNGMDNVRIFIRSLNI